MYNQYTWVLQLQQVQKEEIPYFKYCQKLGGVQRRDIYVSPTKAATFLHLIKNRCDKDTALRFTQRRICKWDTTIKQDGPSTCRILRPKENKEKRIHGWQNIGLEMYYENKDTVADIHQLQLDQDNDVIQREIEKNEMRLKNDFKNKIAHLQQFYRELNQKYSFSSSDPNFKEKITNAKLDLISKRNQPIKYLKTKGMKYIELFNEISQNKQLADHGLFNRLQVFNQLRTDDCKVKEKLLGELYKQKKESQSQHHKELQHNIQIYDNIEEQSGQMLKIIDQNNDFSMSLRKNQPKLIVSQKTIAFAEDFILKFGHQNFNKLLSIIELNTCLIIQVRIRCKKCLKYLKLLRFLKALNPQNQGSIFLLLKVWMSILIIVSINLHTRFQNINRKCQIKISQPVILKKCCKKEKIQDVQFFHYSFCQNILKRQIIQIFLFVGLKTSKTYILFFNMRKSYMMAVQLNKEGFQDISQSLAQYSLRVQQSEMLALIYQRQRVYKSWKLIQHETTILSCQSIQQIMTLI